MIRERLNLMKLNHVGKDMLFTTSMCKYIKETTEGIGWLSMKYAGFGKACVYFLFTSVSPSNNMKVPKI